MTHQSSRKKTTVKNCIHVLAKIIKLIKELIGCLYWLCARLQIHEVYNVCSDVYVPGIHVKVPILKRLQDSR